MHVTTKRDLRIVKPKKPASTGTEGTLPPKCHQIAQDYFKWAKPTETTFPTNVCTSRNKCISTRALVLNEVLSMIGKQDLAIALNPWKTCSKYDFCVECQKVAQQACDSGRAYIWDNLGRYFFGDNWDELEDTKSEILPAVWKSR